MGIKTIKNFKKKIKIRTLEPSGTRKIKGHYLQLNNANVGQLFIPGLENGVVKLKGGTKRVKNKKNRWSRQLTR